MLTIPESFYREGDLENYAPKKYIIAFFLEFILSCIKIVFLVDFGGGSQLCGPLFNACPYLAPFPLGGFEEGRSASDR